MILCPLLHLCYIRIFLLGFITAAAIAYHNKATHNNTSYSNPKSVWLWRLALKMVKREKRR
jgi:hypothetical protein